MFAHPQDIKRASEYALNRGQNVSLMREQPGEIMGLLAHAHPFLEGNGRTIMVVHAELAHRAGISISWKQTDKTDYLAALTDELTHPDQGHLDRYLKPFVQNSIDHQKSISTLKTLKGLGASNPKKVKRDFGGR